MSPISEDELRTRLREVQPSSAPAGYAESLLQQGRLRRTRQRWVSGLAVAAAVATIGLGALVVGDRIGRDDALPATPSPTPTMAQPTPTATPTGSPTVASTPSPSSSPSPSEPTAASSVMSTPSGTSPTTPMTFLHQGVRGDGESTRDWTAATSVTGPCDTDAWSLAGRRGAVERRAITGGGGDGGPTGEAYVVFAEAGDAVAFMGELRALARGCVTTSGGVTKGLVADLPGPWGEGIAFTHFPNQETVGGGPVGLAVRSGRAVAMSASAGPFTDTRRVDAGLVSSARPAVAHLFPQLCRYTQAGC